MAKILSISIRNGGAPVTPDDFGRMTTTAWKVWSDGQTIEVERYKGQFRFRDVPGPWAGWMSKKDMPQELKRLLENK